jgi:hypothetical protein
MLELHNVPVSGGDWFWLVGFLVRRSGVLLVFWREASACTRPPYVSRLLALSFCMY